MSLPLVGTAVLYYTLERIRKPEPHEAVSRESPPRTQESPPLPRETRHRTPYKRSFTPKLSKSRIAAPSSDLSLAQSEPLPSPSPSIGSSHASPASSSLLLSPSARRRLPSTSNPVASTSSSLTSFSAPPRPRTTSTTSRRSSVSSIGAHSTRTSSTFSGFQPISKESSKPLPPLLHSNGSIRSSMSQEEEDGFDSYFDVRLPPSRAEEKGYDRKGKGKMVDTDSAGGGIGLGLPPPQTTATATATFSRSTSTSSSMSKAASHLESDKPAEQPTSTATKRSFSLPALFKRKPPSKVPPPPGNDSTGGDAKERLRNSIAPKSKK
ncbi:uncharacterized protein JCM6883_003305 [Sporobolomyces salmoneus]|uniref:uncharacterized protein n=1 Tax=Sporobolomyces salmoneus TaxID=183962 RepID=UPI00316B0076